MPKGSVGVMEIIWEVGTSRSNISQILSRYNFKADRFEKDKDNRANIRAGKQEEIMGALTLAKIEK